LSIAFSMVTGIGDAELRIGVSDMSLANYGRGAFDVRGFGRFAHRYHG
jgi:hypothetical protein